MSDKLKPCPFCGCEAVLFPAHGMQIEDLVRCGNFTPECICARYGPFNIPQWNTRADTAHSSGS